MTKSAVMMLGALLAGSCGGGGGDPVDVDHFGTSLASALCKDEFRCCTDAEIMQDFKDASPPITTEAGCEQFYAGFFGGLLTPSWKMSISQGRLSYDADAAGNCVALFTDLACGSTMVANMDFTQGCEQFLIPLVHDGDGCTQSDECTSGFCAGAGSSSDGVCATKPGLGAQCEGTCADGLFCDFSGAGTPMCAMPKADGMPCTGDDECTSGSCNGDTTGMTCGPRPEKCTGR